MWSRDKNGSEDCGGGEMVIVVEEVEVVEVGKVELKMGEEMIAS